jgi:hypothetical protein
MRRQRPRSASTASGSTASPVTNREFARFVAETGHVTVAAVWKRYGVKPWKAETFRFSTDPELEAKVSDMVGLYLRPLANAIVLCVDEMSQIQALNRTQKTLPMQPGHVEQRTHDCVGRTAARA